VVKVAAGECKRQAASLQRTAAKDRIAAKDRLRLFNKLAESSAKEVLQQKSHCSERATAAKGPPQRKRHRSERYKKK